MSQPLSNLGSFNTELPEEFSYGESYQVKLLRPVEWPANSGMHLQPGQDIRITGMVAEQIRDSISAYRKA